MNYAIDENEGELTLAVTVASPLGLHARPAARLTREAQRFGAEITVSFNGSTADVKSILDMMSLGAGQNSRLVFRASGVDARDALERIAGVFAANFEE